jgi:hypothetical protein
MRANKYVTDNNDITNDRKKTKNDYSGVVMYKTRGGTTAEHT